MERQGHSRGRPLVSEFALKSPEAQAAEIGRWVKERAAAGDEDALRLIEGFHRTRAGRG